MLKPSYIFKFSLGIGIFVLLVSMFGSAPTQVDAAPKPSKTPKPTKTDMPTRTRMPTQTNTPLPTFTDTPEPTFTFTPTPTDTPTNTPTPIVPNLLAYWKFDEGTGGSVADASGNGHTLTLTSVSGSDFAWFWDSFSAPVAFTNPFALVLNFASSGGQAQQYGTDSGTINLANQSFSVAMWVKRTYGENREEFFFSQGTNGSTDQLLHLGFRASGVFTCAFWGNDLETSAITGDLSWHHYACTYDATTQIRKAYKDGLLVGSDTSSPFTGSGAVNIGRVAGGSRHFVGTVDEARIYDGALSIDQVAELANLSSVPCRISATIFPPSGYVTPSEVELFASDASNCGIPLEYHWACGSPTNIRCPEFMATVNVPPYNNQFLIIDVEIDDIYDIGVWVCLPGDYDIDPDLCSATFRTYQAQEI